jgi:tRNA pseudouridine55 synthase
LLVILVGRATRLARWVERQAKWYCADAVLGVTTDTDDRTGTTVRSMTPARWPDRAAVADALRGLEGTALQRPPAYSARRIGGRRSYAMARAGEKPELPAKPVTVHRIELVSWTPPVVRFRAEVSAGTYLRALGRDLGERLGLGGHLQMLRRESVGRFRVEEAIQPDALDRGTPLLPAAALVGHLPTVELDPEEVRQVGHGRSVSRENASGEAALLRKGQLVAVAEGRAGAWHPRVVLEPA